MPITEAHILECYKAYINDETCPYPEGMNARSAEMTMSWLACIFHDQRFKRSVSAMQCNVASCWQEFMLILVIEGRLRLRCLFSEIVIYDKQNRMLIKIHIAKQLWDTPTGLARVGRNSLAYSAVYLPAS